MTKNNMTFYCLSLISLIIADRAVAKDPFQPFDASQCAVFTTQLNGWQLNAVLISASQRHALISHKVLGIKKVELASQPFSIYGQVTQIELTHIEFSVFPPCPPNRATLSFTGVS